MNEVGDGVFRVGANDGDMEAGASKRTALFVKDAPVEGRVH
jgi:hypothetical protein